MSIDLYPHSALLSPQSVGDVDHICDEIHAACRGFGTDEHRLLKTMGGQTPEERCLVPLRYKEKYGKALIDVVKSECGSRSFGRALQYLAVDPATAEVLMIAEACKHIGTDELLLYSILCGRTNKDMEVLKRKYSEHFSKELEGTVKRELSGNLETLLVKVLQARQETYDPSYHTEEKVKEDCERLHKAGLGSWGTDEKGLFNILSSAPPEELQKMDKMYVQLHKNTIKQAIQKELSGTVEDAALFLLGMKLHPYQEVAKLIDTACKGFGTNEHLLTCTLIRYQGIMKHVAEAQNDKFFALSIKNRVKWDTSGDFESVLVEVIKTGEQL